MIYLFAGDDTKNKILSYEKFIKSIPKDVETFSFTRNDFDENQIISFYSGSGLFFNKSMVIFVGLFVYEETRDFLCSKLPEMGQSNNIFVFLESKLNKSILDEFKKVSEGNIKFNIFELPKIKKEKFDNFLLANAFANKDKLNLWIYFRQAVDLGVVMEELAGVLFWKIKDMILKRNFSKFSEEELKGFIAKLSYLLPEARVKGLDAETVFERFLLEAF
jgi:hypothetical protein